MIQPVALVSRIAGQVYAQTAERIVVYCGENDCGMGFTIFQLRQFTQRPGGVVVGGRGNGQGNEHLIRMQTGVMVAQVLALQFLYGFNDFRGDQVGLFRDARKFFQCVQNHCSGRP